MSTTNAAQKMREIAESTEKDDRLRHLAALGDFNDEVFLAKVVVMTYVRRSRTTGGIILTERNIEEDRFQGKIGLVVSVGPAAFQDDGAAKFYGARAAVGDWVLYRPADGMEFFYNGCTLRLFDDVSIMCKVADPTLYW